jgi:hypothetical protein
MTVIAKRVAVWALATLWLTGAAAAADDPIKTLMGENFARVGVILNELIGARYESLPQQAELIKNHAVQLIEKPPASVSSKPDLDMFVTYANFLKRSASSLEAVTAELLKRSQASTQPSGELSVDYLRVAAAEHFGNVVTACVLCHNQFRRRSL